MFFIDAHIGEVESCVVSSESPDSPGRFKAVTLRGEAHSDFAPIRSPVSVPFSMQGTHTGTHTGSETEAERLAYPVSGSSAELLPRRWPWTRRSLHSRHAGPMAFGSANPASPS